MFRDTQVYWRPRKWWICFSVLIVHRSQWWWTQGSHTFSKIIFQTFSILIEKTLIPSFTFTFPKFYSWNTMQKTSAKLLSAVKKKNWINKRLNLEFLYFFNTLCNVWPNSILSQGLENRFHNSVLSKPCGKPARVSTNFQKPLSILFQFVFKTNWKNFNTIIQFFF